MTNNVALFNTIKIGINPLVIPEKIKIYFDGSSEPTNPGVASYGWVVLSGSKDEKEIARGYGVASKSATNNYAEYCGLGFALQWIAQQKWIGSIEIYGDSKLILSQISGEWKCNKDHLVKLRDRCLKILQILGNEYTLNWIPRELNDMTDMLSQKAYGEATGQKYPERKHRKGYSTATGEKSPERHAK